MTIEYHEPPEEVSPENRDTHRALSSLVEELEAIDWYQQRIGASDDAELKSILDHNRKEEIEHVAMLVECLRRRMPKLDEELKTYLYATGPIVEVEQGREEAVNRGEAPRAGDLGIGPRVHDGDAVGGNEET